MADMRSLKKVQGKKKREAEATEAKRRAAGPTADQEEQLDTAEGGTDLLSSKDEDVIF